MYKISGSIASCLDKRAARLQKKGFFIIATNELDTEKLSHVRHLELYKDQSKVERGFRFLKDPKFLASSLFLKSPERIETLLMVMTICLLVYSALEHRIRKALKEANQSFADQKGRPSRVPTTRWVFQCFAGIHLLHMEGRKQIVLNLNENHRLILNLLGKQYSALYS